GIASYSGAVYSEDDSAIKRPQYSKPAMSFFDPHLVRSGFFAGREFFYDYINISYRISCPKNNDTLSYRQNYFEKWHIFREREKEGERERDGITDVKFVKNAIITHITVKGHVAGGYMTFYSYM